MYFRLKFRKFVNHWYPEVPHDSLSDISLCPVAEEILDNLSKQKDYDEDVIEIALIEEFSVISDYDILQFEEPDITRWFTTNDDFDMNVWINDNKFVISSDLYSILEQVYQFKFHENIYRVEIIQYENERKEK